MTLKIVLLVVSIISFLVSFSNFIIIKSLLKMLNSIEERG